MSQTTRNLCAILILNNCSYIVNTPSTVILANPDPLDMLYGYSEALTDFHIVCHSAPPPISTSSTVDCTAQLHNVAQCTNLRRGCFTAQTSHYTLHTAHCTRITLDEGSCGEKVILPLSPFEFQLLEYPLPLPLQSSLSPSKFQLHRAKPKRVS